MLNSSTPCAVQGKIRCILRTVARDVSSTKRPGQSYCIEASNELSEYALSSDIEGAIPTEKIDGTCCHVRQQNGKSMLWARLDRKPKKNAQKRFKTFQQKYREWETNEKGNEPEFQWKVPDDLKDVSDHWVPANDVMIDEVTQCPMPDRNGHIPGWVLVDVGNPQYRWHNSVVDYDAGVALTLKPSGGDDNDAILQLTATPLSELEGKTLELIGTNINGNPYCLGDKRRPFHALIEHGSIRVKGIKQATYEGMFDWFLHSPFANVEGIVWHFKDGNMLKLHRHHLKLPWPLPDQKLTALTSYAVRVAKMPASVQFSRDSMLNILVLLGGQSFDRLCDIPVELCKL